MGNRLKLRQAFFGVALVLLLSLAACGSEPPTPQPSTVKQIPVFDDGPSDAAPPREMPEHPGGAYGFPTSASNRWDPQMSGHDRRQSRREPNASPARRGAEAYTNSVYRPRDYASGS